MIAITPVNAAIVAETSLNKVSIFIADGELLCNLAELIPGGGDVVLGESSGCPHVGVIVHSCGHKAVVGVVNLSVYKVSGNADEVGFHILDRNVVGSHVVDEQVMFAVMHIENCGAIIALKSEGQFGEVIIPRIFDESDGYIGVNCGILIRKRLEQICCTGPKPELNLDVLAVVNSDIGVILDSRADNGERICCGCFGCSFFACGCFGYRCFRCGFGCLVRLSGLSGCSSALLRCFRVSAPQVLRENMEIFGCDFR